MTLCDKTLGYEYCSCRKCEDERPTTITTGQEQRINELEIRVHKLEQFVAKVAAQINKGQGVRK